MIMVGYMLIFIGLLYDIDLLVFYCYESLIYCYILSIG